MQIILLERVDKLGQMGDVVTVKNGYARNFLLPRGKAMRATKDNIAYFETQKKVLEADNLKRKGEADAVAKKMDGLKVVIIRAASEVGQLYGSVSARDIADVVSEAGFHVGRQQVRMDRAYKMLGLFPIEITLHPEVKAVVTINIARTEEEAKLQEEKGGALIAEDAKEDEKPTVIEQPAAETEADAAPTPANDEGTEEGAEEKEST